MITAQKLSQLALLAPLDEEAVRGMLPHVHERAVTAGQMVLLEGEPCRAVYFVVRGLARSKRLSPDGREQVLAYLGPGSVFGLVAAVDAGPSLATVEAVIDTLLYGIPCPVFGGLMNDHPTLAVSVADRLTADVRRLSDMVEDLALHTVSTRLARFLLNQAENPRPTRRRWTQEEIAARIGTAREMVSRTLRDWTQAGLIRREHGRVTIVDRDGMEREARG